MSVHLLVSERVTYGSTPTTLRSSPSSYTINKSPIGKKEDKIPKMNDDSFPDGVTFGNTLEQCSE